MSRQQYHLVNGMERPSTGPEYRKTHRILCGICAVLLRPALRAAMYMVFAIFAGGLRYVDADEASKSEPDDTSAVNDNNKWNLKRCNTPNKNPTTAGARLVPVAASSPSVNSARRHVGPGGGLRHPPPDMSSPEKLV